MPSPNYQYVINLVLSLPIRKGPGVFLEVLVWNILLLKTKFLCVAKFTILTPLSLLS